MKYRAALDIDPTFSLAQQYLNDARLWKAISEGDALMRDKSYGAAIGKYRDAVGIDGSNSAAADRLRRVLALKANQDGDARFDAKEYGAAIVEYRTALQHDPANGHAVERLKEATTARETIIAEQLAQSGNHLAAVYKYDSILRAGPSNSTMANQLAQRRDQAKAAYVATLVGQARGAMASGDFSSASRKLDEASRIDADKLSEQIANGEPMTSRGVVWTNDFKLAARLPAARLGSIGSVEEVKHVKEQVWREIKKTCVDCTTQAVAKLIPYGDLIRKDISLGRSMAQDRRTYVERLSDFMRNTVNCMVGAGCSAAEFYSDNLADNLGAKEEIRWVHAISPRTKVIQPADPSNWPGSSKH